MYININSAINILFDGDSKTIGVDGLADQDYPNMVRKLMLANGFTNISFGAFGISGRTIETLISEFGTKVAPSIDANKINVLFFSESINAVLRAKDPSVLNGNITGRSAIRSTQTYIDQALNAGIDVFILITDPYPVKVAGSYSNVYVTDERRIQQEIYFDMANSNQLTGVDLVIDERLHPQLGGEEGQEINYDYYLNDSFHYNHLGYDLRANYVYKRIMEEIFT